MFNASLKKRIDELHNTIDSIQLELKDLRYVFSSFPDLEFIANKRGKIYFAESANQLVNDIDIVFSYGAFIVSPFIKVKNIKVYSKPYELYIGSEGVDCPYDINPNWTTLLSNYNLDAIIYKVEPFTTKYSLPYDESELE